MNRTLLTLSVFLLLVACQRDTPSPLDDILQVSKKSVTLRGQLSSSDTVQITSNTEWLVSIPQDMSWLKVEPSSGSGNQTLIFTSIEENDSLERSGNIEIKTKSGGKSVTIKVTQSAQLDSMLSINFGLVGSDALYYLLETPEGDFIAVGDSAMTEPGAPSSGQSPRVMKFDKTGKIIWEKILHDGYSYGIASPSPGMYVVMATARWDFATVSDYLSGDDDVSLTGLDTDGNVLWEKVIGGSNDEECYSLKATTDGNLVIAGYTNSHDYDVKSNDSSYTTKGGWVVKLTGSGDIIWEKTFFPSFDNKIFHATPLLDGSIIFGGSYSVQIPNSTSAETRGWYGKIAADGTLQWSTETKSSSFYCTSVKSNGDCVFGGIDFNSGDLAHPKGGFDAMLICTDPSGNIRWKNAYGGSATDKFWTLTESTAGNTLAIGTTSSGDGDIPGNSGGKDALLMEIGPDGTLIKSKTYGSVGDDEGWAVIQTSTNQVAFVGFLAGVDLTRRREGWFAIPNF
jgi:hypothetical protein